MKKYLFLYLFVIINLPSFSQSLTSNDCKDTTEFYPNGKLWKKYKKCFDGVIDTVYTYSKDGKLESFFDFGPRNSNRPITYHFFYNSGLTYKVGQYILNQDNMPVDVGTSKEYWKNGSLMDSIIYERGEQFYRARFNKQRVLQFEEKDNERIVYDKNGAISSHEKK